jgi:PBP1b-binding outer membrane lipoprotein LpoB
MKLAAALLTLAIALTGCASVEPAPRPLYRDPVLDGAADV